MITFIAGKPGDGKSLYATKLILDDLVEDRCYIVTNVPLVPSAVHAYVTAERAKRKIETPFSFDDSVRVLEDGEVYEFYRRRSGGLVLAPSPDFLAQEDGTKRLERPEFVAQMKTEFLRIRGDVAYQRPVHYYIDEAHNFFSSREWANTGRGLLYYASQHRHLHDNVWFITQVVENVEKQLRGLASELHRVRNNLRRSMGPVKLRPVFKVHKFYGVPNEGATVSPYDISEMRLDPSKVAGCYRTVGALGVQTKPEKIRNNGWLPWWVLVVGGVVIVLALVFFFLALPALGMAGAKKIVLGDAGQRSARALGGGSVVAPDGVPTGDALGTSRDQDAGRRASAQRPDSPSPKLFESDRVTVTGYVSRGPFATVWLSDGRVLTERDLLEITRREVTTRKGERFFFATIRRETPSTLPLSVARDANRVIADAPSRSVDRDEGSWVRGADGVARLKERSTIGLSGAVQSSR